MIRREDVIVPRHRFHVSETVNGTLINYEVREANLDPNRICALLMCPVPQNTDRIRITKDEGGRLLVICLHVSERTDTDEVYDVSAFYYEAGQWVTLQEPPPVEDDV